jgi:hypothetical protein
MGEKNFIPTRKTGAGAIAGALTTVVITVSRDALHYQMSPDLAAAVTFIIMFVVSYFTPNVTPQDREEPTDEK